MNQARHQNSLRIIGGSWRSRKIQFAPEENLRPTSNRIRETLFNWLQDHVAGETCLDMFAGSGACGLEAMSRGASSALFIDSNPTAAAMIEKNLAALTANQCEVLCTNAMTWLVSPQLNNERSFGLVFIDPPYQAGLELSCCLLLEKSGKLKPSAYIYLESDKQDFVSELPVNWQLEKAKQAGKVHFFLFKRIKDTR
jgi:16S rRNA (guanine966-N2)-methyltransferase